MIEQARAGTINSARAGSLWNAHELLAEYCRAHNIKLDTVPPHSLLEMAAIRAADVLNHER